MLATSSISSYLEYSSEVSEPGEAIAKNKARTSEIWLQESLYFTSLGAASLLRAVLLHATKHAASEENYCATAPEWVL